MAKKFFTSFDIGEVNNLINDVTSTPQRKYQASLIFKNKLLKTIAGLTSIVLFAKPINDCVEKYIMKKYVNQGIDTFSDKVKNVHFTKPSKLHTIIKGQS